MYATHYDPKLADTIYAEVYFSIDGEQFPGDADLSHEVNGRIHEHEDAIAQAQKLANQFNRPIEVAVYGTWGYFGKERIDSFVVNPVAKPCPIQGVRDDLSDIKAQMFGA